MTTRQTRQTRQTRKTRSRFAAAKANKAADKKAAAQTIMSFFFFGFQAGDFLFAISTHVSRMVAPSSL